MKTRKITNTQLTHEECEKLLRDLKKRHAEFLTETKRLELGAEAPYVANQKAWEKWVEENITSRGLNYTFDQQSGEPKALFKVLAGDLVGESPISIGA